MRLLVVFAFVTNTIAAPRAAGLPSFEISGYSSRSAIPDMKVTFEDGVSDSLVLEPYSSSPCNFIGRLANHPSSAAVTGCLSKPGDKMAITMLTELNTKSHMYELDFFGNVEALENPFKDQKEPSVIYPLDSRVDEDKFTKNDDAMGDELVDPVMEQFADAVTSEAIVWPPELFAQVKMGYEKTMKAQMDADGTSFDAWIDSVMTHVQTYYQHPTLPTKVTFKYDKSKTIFKNVYWPSTDSLDAASKAGWEDNDPTTDLYVWFGKDPSYYGTVGLAWLGGACNDYLKTSFNEWRKTPAETAGVVAHEIGHNLGMSHDFDKKHGGDNSYCNGQGIMSYGDLVAKWSTCSVSDFKGYFTEEEWGDECLKDWTWTKPKAVCGKRNTYSNCDQMANEWNYCVKKADYMIEMCPESSCPRTKCSGGSGVDMSSQCKDLCPGTGCTVSAQNLCTDKGCWGQNCYGGCNGNYRAFFAENCKQTCGLC